MTDLRRNSSVSAASPSSRLGIAAAGSGLIIIIASTCVASRANAGTDADSAGSVSGLVSDECGPLAGAVVRVQTTDMSTVTDGVGRFQLSGATSEPTVSISAWAPGHYISAKEARWGDGQVDIRLERHLRSDCASYRWAPALVRNGQSGKACEECHSSADTELQFTLPADEWREDAHARSALNPRFLSVYNGTDLNGHPGPPRRYGRNRDYGRFPLPPDPQEANFGPGFKLDFPHSAGNCAACHVPLAAVNAPNGTDPNGIEPLEKEGISCDFCHKIVDVRLAENTGVPRDNMPGVLSYEFLRPGAERQFFAGPLDDVAPGDDTFALVYSEGKFCAPCHRAVFWDTVIYNSFGEWLDSPYSDPVNGKACQDCHMPRLGATQFVRSDKGGRKRDPNTIFSHRMPGAASEELLRNSVTMIVNAEANASQVRVNVTIRNDGAGHHVPTDSPLRQVILVVSAKDGEENNLTRLDGPTIPTWGGVGRQGDRAYAGRPGKIFARTLEETWTGISPTAAFWNPTRVLSDSRIAAQQSDSSTYVFENPAGQSVTVRVRLVYRRAFYELQEQKGWNVPDIVMKDFTTVVAPLPGPVREADLVGGVFPQN